MTVMELAKEDSKITGDRFVVEHEGSPLAGNSRCCVVDAEWQSVIRSGLTFKDAYRMAERMNKDHNGTKNP